MERKGLRETTSSVGFYGGEERGGGGKLRRPTARKPPATPYSRPAAKEADRGEQRWLSKLVDPACRLISGGASLIFPSFFSKSPEADSNADDLETAVGQVAIAEDRECGINSGMPRTTGVVGPSPAADRSKIISDFVLPKQDKKDDLPEENGLSEIEQLLKGKKFSRDEVTRLMEIIQSRAAEHPNVEQEKKYASETAGGETKRPIASHEIMKTPSERNQEDLPALWKTSTPLPLSAIPNEVGASPVEIAKAYMGSRTLEIGNSSKEMISNDEKSLLLDADLASKPFIPSPSPKPSAYWPGAMAQDRRDYLTPQSQRGRFGLHNFPRTPYSRTIFSKSKSKVTQLPGDNEKLLTPSTFNPKSQSSSVFGQVKSSSDTLDDSYGSVGPIRRSRHKLVTQTTPRGSGFYGSSSVGPSKLENSNFSRSFLSTTKKNSELNSFQSQSVDRNHRSFEVGVPTVHPQSSQIARTILEHIDRHPPTPKDKSEELKLAITGKRPVSSGPSGDPHGHDDGLLHAKAFNSQKIVNLDERKKSSQDINVDKGNSLFMVPSRENAGKAIDTVSNSRFDVHLSNGGVSQFKSSHEVFNLEKKPSGTKPVLSSISIDKSEPKWKLSSDQSSGFTFPVSTSPEVFSEPPTPTIVPLFSSGSQQLNKDEKEVPSYYFGSTASKPALVFSFPSTSSGAIQNDTSSDVKFSFGSDKPRLSFSSIKKDAICIK
ncbi:hypothetical protein UlMin_003059 [Ulmus minor]